MTTAERDSAITMQVACTEFNRSQFALSFLLSGGDTIYYYNDIAFVLGMILIIMGAMDNASQCPHNNKQT